MITVAEHTYEESLLPEKANILDLGCRGFQFAMELTRLGYCVWTVDPDPQVLGDHIVAYTCYPQLIMTHYQIAVSDYNGKCSLIKSPDPQAVSIKKGDDIYCMTLKNLSERISVDFWDLIKIDIEGSEYEVIMSFTEPPAKQLSIEFHLHTKIYGEAQVKEMEDKLVSLGYYPAKHDKTSEHGCGMNYWDSLWILK